jgi:hypothetical protein
MTDATSTMRNLSRYGVWTRVPVTPQHALKIEKWASPPMGLRLHSAS